MQAFEVSVNGEKLCLAGIGVDGVLTAMVSWASQKGDGGSSLDVGGLMSGTKEHLRWVSQKPLTVGDTIEVKLVETEVSDTPVRKYRRDPNPQD